LRKACAPTLTFDCPLFGAIPITPGPIVVSITCLAPFLKGRGTACRCQSGDRVFVTGTIGDAALGVMMRNGKRWK
jgi:thiamine-monophosphate kinase